MAATTIDGPTTATGELLTADGRPLKESLRRSLRRRKLTALALVAPAVVFLFVLFGMPVIYLMTWSVDDTLVNEAFPRTFAVYGQWDGEALPPSRSTRRCSRTSPRPPGSRSGARAPA